MEKNETGNNGKNFHHKKYTSTMYGDYIQSSLFIVMKPLFLILKAAGLYHMKKYGLPQNRINNVSTEVEIVGHRKSDVKFVLFPSQCYAYFVTIVSICYAMKVSIIRLAIVDDIAQIVVAISYNTLCALNFIICLRACHKATCIPGFFLEWNKLTVFKEDEMESLKGMKKSVYIYCFVFCKLILLCITIMLYRILQTNTLDALEYPLNSSHQYAWIFVAVQIVLIISQYSSWIGTVLLFLAISRVLSMEFDFFNSQIRQSHSSKKIYTNGELDVFYRWHLQLCSLVKQADEFLGPYIGCFIFYSLLNICFGLYMIIWSTTMREDLLLLLGSLYFFFITVLILGVLCITSAVVYCKVGTASSKYLC